VYRNALATLPPGVAPPETVRERFEHARAVVAKHDTELGTAIEERLARLQEPQGRGDSRRADRCIDLLTGRRTRYNSQPTFMYFPEIPTVEFFERDEFPWLDAIEAASEEIHAELVNVLISDREGLEPYIVYPEGVPLDQWKELNKSRRWSAYYL
jgi:aspartate beta-hydroxylase